MNTPTENARRRADGGEADKTLRLIASLPGPEGLEDRVKIALHATSRRGRVLRWPGGLGSSGRGWIQGGWMHRTVTRCAAAAAIVFVVAGGGWGVYSHVQPAPAPRAVALPHVTAPGGFSNAGAMRTPQTLNGTVLSHPLTGATKQANATVNKDFRASQKKGQQKKRKIDQSRKVAN